MNCYFQGCNNKGTTKEHIPPRSFFPKGEKEQLLTVKSCVDHNNAKSADDLYVLAQICMNAAPANRAREVFLTKVRPQLDFNNSALRKKLVKDSVQMPDGSIAYPVDVARFDDFFSALSFGLIFKSCGSRLPRTYHVGHIYPAFQGTDSPMISQIEKEMEELYANEPMDVVDFGKPSVKNERIYSAKIFGIRNFKSSITIVHLFYGTFKAISLLTR